MWKTATFLRSLWVLLLALLHFGPSNSDAAWLCNATASQSVVWRFDYWTADATIYVTGSPQTMVGNSYLAYTRPTGATPGTFILLYVASNAANLAAGIWTSSWGFADGDENLPYLYVRLSETYAEKWTARLDHINNDSDPVYVTPRSVGNYFVFGSSMTLAAGSTFSERPTYFDGTVRGVGTQPTVPYGASQFWWVPTVLDGLVEGVRQKIWDGTRWTDGFSISGSGTSGGANNGGGGQGTGGGTTVTNTVDFTAVTGSINTQGLATQQAIQAASAASETSFSLIRSILTTVSNILTSIRTALFCIQDAVCSFESGFIDGSSVFMVSEPSGEGSFFTMPNELGGGTPIGLWTGFWWRVKQLVKNSIFFMRDFSLRCLDASQGIVDWAETRLEQDSYGNYETLSAKISRLESEIFGFNSQSVTDIQSAITDFLNLPPFANLKSFLTTDSTMITGVQLVRSDWVVEFPNFSGSLNAGAGGGGLELSIFPGDHPKIAGTIVFMRCLIAWVFYLMLVWQFYTHFHSQLLLFNSTNLRAPPAGQAIFGVNVNWKAVAVNGIFYLGIMLAFITAYAALFVLFDVSCCGFSELLGFMNGSDSARMAVGMLNYTIPLDCILQGLAAYVFFKFAWLPISQFFLISLRVVHV